MIQDLFCRLYVNQVDEKALLRELSQVLKGTVQGRSVFNEVIDFSWSKNTHVFDTSQAEFMCYPSTFEVTPRSEITGQDAPNDPQAFVNYLLQAIVEIRKSGAEVVASCEYEDLIAEKTGWNWSASTPVHPPVGTT